MKNKILVFGTGGLCKQLLNNSPLTDNFYLYNDSHSYEPFFKKYNVVDKISEDFTHFIVALSGPKNRLNISNSLYSKGLKSFNYIDSSLPKDILIYDNIIILKNVFIESSVEIKSGTLINVGSQIHHDAHIGEYCEIGPMSCILGNVKIGDCTFIGASTTILPKIKIGNNCIIGAGSLVTKDVPDNQVWFGNPAVFKYNNL